MFRARVTKAFEISVRPGTVLVVEILDGAVKAGDSVRLHTDAAGCVLIVRAVEFVNTRDRGDPAIIVDGVTPSDVPTGTEVTGVAAASH